MWEEHRRKQEARREEKSSFFLPACNLSSPVLITVGTLVVPPK